tara:strand:- start:980 stop:2617 length:1638 start_codon:yes stop_codon:yes gene_type:complete
MPLPNQVFSLTYPGTATAGSRASTYVSQYSKRRWQNWELALKEATRQFGDEDTNIQRQQQLADQARSAILGQIQDLVDYQQALEKGAIDENYARERFNASADQRAAQFSVGEINRARQLEARLNQSGSGSGSGTGAAGFALSGSAGGPGPAGVTVNTAAGNAATAEASQALQQPWAAQQIGDILNENVGDDYLFALRSQNANQSNFIAELGTNVHLDQAGEQLSQLARNQIIASNQGGTPSTSNERALAKLAFFEDVIAHWMSNQGMTRPMAMMRLQSMAQNDPDQDGLMQDYVEAYGTMGYDSPAGQQGGPVDMPDPVLVGASTVDPATVDPARMRELDEEILGLRNQLDNLGTGPLIPDRNAIERAQGIYGDQFAANRLDLDFLGARPSPSPAVPTMPRAPASPTTEVAVEAESTSTPELPEPPTTEPTAEQLNARARLESLVAGQQMYKDGGLDRPSEMLNVVSSLFDQGGSASIQALQDQIIKSYPDPNEQAEALAMLAALSLRQFEETKAKPADKPVSEPAPPPKETSAPVAGIEETDKE